MGFTVCRLALLEKIWESSLWNRSAACIPYRHGSIDVLCLMVFSIEFSDICIEAFVEIF